MDRRQVHGLDQVHQAVLQADQAEVLLTHQAPEAHLVRVLQVTVGKVNNRVVFVIYLILQVPKK